MILLFNACPLENVTLLINVTAELCTNTTICVGAYQFIRRNLSARR